MTNIEAAKTLVLIARMANCMPSGTDEAIAMACAALLGGWQTMPQEENTNKKE